MSEKRAKLLIIDDDIMNREILEAFLEDTYDVTLAHSGKQGLMLAKQVQPNAILLDVSMPDINGFEVCRQLKGDTHTAHIPIMFISGYDSSDDLEESERAGADDFLPRPFNGDELIVRVAALLSNHDA